MKNIAFLVVFGMGMITSFTVHAELLFHETFESANMSNTDAEGFSWAANNRTSVVYGDGSLNKVVWNNGPKDSVVTDGRDWSTTDGFHSLRFRYSAGEAMTEQRFDLGAAHREIWIRYWTRVPVNYYHNNPASGAANNKFFALWMDGYSQEGDGSTFWLSLENAGSGNSNLAFTSSKGYFNASMGMQQGTPFINATRDRGRWMSVVIHLKCQSSDGNIDGVVETWRRWKNEASYTKIHSANNVNLRVPPGGPNGFKMGYLFGWANGEYLEDTEWLVDDFEVSTTSLLENTVTDANPNPPKNFSVVLSQ